MFESATTLIIHNGRLDETIAILRKTVVPILLAQPGLLSLALIPQPDQNRLSLVSIWQSLAHAEAVEANPQYRQAIQQLDPLIRDTAIQISSKPWQPDSKLLVRSAN
jgi:quinol monooxygenase YgiN